MEVFGAWCLILLALVTVKRSNRTDLPRTRTLWKQSHILLAGYETKSPKLFPIFQTDRYGLDLPGSQTVVWSCWCTEGRTDMGVTFPMCLPCFFFAGGGRQGLVICPPQATNRAAILKATPHSGSASAAVRNHDWRWRILLSWRDTPDSERVKRC